MASTHPPVDPPLSAFERMAILLARELRDGELLRVGVAMPVVEAAVRLAQLLHGPNIELNFFGARMNAAHLERLPLPAFSWDHRVVRWAESYSDTGHRFDRLKDWDRSVFFIGGVQVDRFGNTNLIGVGPDHRRLRFRGPGTVGTATLSTHVGRYYIVLNAHSPRLLVERCDYVSAVGWGTGGPDARRRLGLPGGGPRLCITPLAVMDFTEDERTMRLVHVQPGVTVDAVRAATGFELAVHPQVSEVPAPSAYETEVLRSRVDPEGRLRRGP